jgi:hypothetical protein
MRQFYLTELRNLVVVTALSLAVTLCVRIPFSFARLISLPVGITLQVLGLFGLAVLGYSGIVFGSYNNLFLGSRRSVVVSCMIASALIGAGLSTAIVLATGSRNLVVLFPSISLHLSPSILSHAL